MTKYLPTIHSLVSFTIVSIIFLIAINITLKIIIKRFNTDNIRIYGMFFNMRKFTIISFSITTFIYIMLVWLLVDLNLSYVYIASIIIMSIMSNLLAEDFPYGFLNMLNTITCLAAIYLVSYFNNLITQDGSTLLVVVKWIIVLFLFMYFTYVTLINLNRLLKVEKTRVIKEKRGNEDENEQFN